MGSDEDKSGAEGQNASVPEDRGAVGAGRMRAAGGDMVAAVEGSGGARGKSGEVRSLRGGRHGISPEIVAHNQRERLLGAIAACVAEHGYNATTIAQITEAATVSRRTFYENFEDKEACFLAAYEALDEYLATLMADAMEGEVEWGDKVAAGLTALVGFLASRPNLARLYLVEATAAGEGTAQAREATARRLIAMLLPGREQSEGREPVPGIEEAVVGGILSLLGRRIFEGEVEAFDSLAVAVNELALSPYLGAGRARTVATRHLLGAD